MQALLDGFIKAKKSEPNFLGILLLFYYMESGE